MTRLEDAMIREFNDEPNFWREQQIQNAIAIIQKVTRASILEINETSIRAAVANGRTPGEIARQYLRTRES